MPKNRIAKAPTKGLTASRDKILASLACYSHTSDWQVSLRLLETITPSGADSGRNHSPEFKSKVALAALKDDQTLSELSQRYGINSNLIVKWKKQLLEQSSEVFASGKGLAPDRESEIQSLQAKIGQLTMENDFLSKALGH
jgi:transposase-like protein